MATAETDPQKLADQIETALIPRPVERRCPCESEEGDFAIIAPREEWDLILQALRAFTPWQSIETALRDGSNILLLTRIHGVTEARFAPGEWTEHHEYGRQYDGPSWICGDDAWQIEVEEGPDGFHDGEATHWRPLFAPPLNPEVKDGE